MNQPRKRNPIVKILVGLAVAFGVSLGAAKGFDLGPFKPVIEEGVHQTIDATVDAVKGAKN